jgi:long-chain acyl-CoA synthetase
MTSSVRAEYILERSAERWPHRAAVIDQRGSRSFEELYVASVEVSRAVYAAGVTPGSIIGISVFDACTFLATLFGVLRAGCVAIPIAPNLSDAEQTRVMTETNIGWLVLDSQTSNSEGRAIRTHSTQVGSCDLFDSYPMAICRHNSYSNPHPLRAFPDAAVIRHTSGTTAKSKGVVLSHRAVRERADTSQHLLGVTRDDVILAPLPLSYHFVASALSCVQAGATLLDCAELIAPEMLTFGATFGATMMYASPLQYELMIRSDYKPPLSRLRRAISTSALLPKRTADVFFQRFGIRLTQVYGIIEVGLPIWNELESIESTALGICKPPYEAIVVDECGHRVPTGEVGELAIRGPGLFSGYLLDRQSHEQKSANHDSLGGDWFLTGDLVAKDELGVILYRGRKKSVINCGGSKIFPEEIEEVLRRAPDIKAVRVSAEPHPLLGSLVIAEVVPLYAATTTTATTTAAATSVEAWRALCYRELSEYKVPKEFRIVESLPQTGSGKLLRH